MNDKLIAVLEESRKAARDETVEYAKTGFHVGWVVLPTHLPSVGQMFAQAGYFLEMATCLDLRESEDVMRLVYTFNRLEATDRHRVHADLSSAAAVETWNAPSLTGHFRAADWFEREIWDMYGVRFEGHPSLRRLLLPDDADFFPLRRDFGRIEDAPPAPAGDAGDPIPGKTP